MEKTNYSLIMKDYAPGFGIIKYFRRGNKDLDEGRISLGSKEDIDFLCGQTKLLIYNSAIILVPLGLEKLFFN